MHALHNEQLEPACCLRSVYHDISLQMYIVKVVCDKACRGTFTCRNMSLGLEVWKGFKVHITFHLYSPFHVALFSITKPPLYANQAKTVTVSRNLAGSAHNIHKSTPEYCNRRTGVAFALPVIPHLYCCFDRFSKPPRI